MIYLTNNYTYLDTGLIWPRHEPETSLTIFINATVLLPDTIYSMEYKRNITELSFHTAQKRAGPAILAGLEEGVRSEEIK